MEKSKGLVYHYCSIEALVNIIRTSSIWLSDYRKMNDFAEEKWIKDKVNNKIREQLISIDKKNPDLTVNECVEIILNECGIKTN